MPTVEVSDEAERFARSRGLSESLALMNALILRGERRVVRAINVDVLSDADVRDRSVIGFRIRTNGTVADALAFDEALQRAIYDKVPAEHQIHFAVRFDFAPKNPSPMDARDFLAIAERYRSCHIEAERRTSVGRSYYTLFHVLLGVLSGKGVTFRGIPEDHYTLISYLTKAGNRAA